MKIKTAIQLKVKKKKNIISQGISTSFARCYNADTEFNVLACLYYLK